mmetsp:Transcript_10901/g.30495  ORF Transcript_10901/g.30495 Transcript_10901/m.30495 type:complete len:301 (-) Transcript_10901:684-1586(-)
MHAVVERQSALHHLVVRKAINVGIRSDPGQQLWEIATTAEYDETARKRVAHLRRMERNDIRIMILGPRHVGYPSPPILLCARPGHHPLFRLPTHLAHRLHALQGVGPVRSLPTQHHGVCPLPHGHRYICHLCPRRQRVRNHTLQHVCGDNTRLAPHTATPDDRILPERHLFHRQLGPQIPPRHHRPVHGVQNLLQMPGGIRRLDLRQNPNPRRLGPLLGLLHQVRPQLVDHSRIPHKGQREIIHIHLKDPPLYIRPVLLRDGGQVGRLAPHVDVPTRAHLPAVHHPTHDTVRIHLHHVHG